MFWISIPTVSAWGVELVLESQSMSTWTTLLYEYNTYKTERIVVCVAHEARRVLAAWHRRTTTRSYRTFNTSHSIELHLVSEGLALQLFVLNKARIVLVTWFRSWIVLVRLIG